MAEALRAARNESRGEPEDAGGGSAGGGGGGELEEDAVNEVGVDAVRRRRQRRRVAREGDEEESSGESSGESNGRDGDAESGDNDTMSRGD